jgi:hypothetical protein
MQSTDNQAFKAVLHGVHDFYGKELSPFAIGVWWEAMRPFDYVAVKDALNRHCVNPDNGQFAPKPADIVRLIGGGTQDAALIAWSKVLRAALEVGTYQTVVFDDPIIHAVIADMGGWPAIGCIKDDERPFRGKEFETRYRGYRLKSSVESFPKMLPGLIDQGNLSKGHMPQEPVLIGNPAAAKRVLLGGKERHLQITRASELVPTP